MTDDKLKQIEDDLWEQVCELEVIADNQILLRESTVRSTLKDGVTNLKTIKRELEAYNNSDEEGGAEAE